MIDARGLVCPMPVVLVQKAVKKDAPETLEVLVDNRAAVENLTRFASHAGYALSLDADGADFKLTLRKK